MILLIMHPGWSMWPGYILGALTVSGDCGYSDRFLGLVIPVALLLMLVLRLFRPNFRTRVLLVILAAGCWLIYLAPMILLRPPWSAMFPVGLADLDWFQEAVETIDFGRSRIVSFMLILTILCILFYLPWPRRREPNAV